MERDALDDEFIQTMLGENYLEIEQNYTEMTKHEKVRIEQWVSTI